MRKSALTVFLILIAACCQENDAQQETHYSEPAWGEAHSGLQTGIEVAEGSYHLDGIVPLRINLRNTGPDLVKFLNLRTSKAFWGANVPVLLAGPDGVHQYQGPVLEPPPPPSPSSWISMRSTQVESVEMKLHLEYWKLSVPGDYVLQFVFGNSESETGTWQGPQRVPIRGLWVGEARSGMVTIYLRSRDK